MTTAIAFSNFAGQLRQFMSQSLVNESSPSGAFDDEFGHLALRLFSLQFEHNAAYRQLCRAQGVSPSDLKCWADIPAAPACAFKELELTSLLQEERTTVFHSSGTTTQQPSRHFHGCDSLALYEASLLPWFHKHLLDGQDSGVDFVSLTPPATEAPHSSLVHMFETVVRKFGSEQSAFCGGVDADGSWLLDQARADAALREAIDANRPVVVLGTAFSFVHLLDELAGRNRRIILPAGSRVLETGGYKGRSRTLPKAELHRHISERLGVPQDHIVCEYGMSELGSQAYDRPLASPRLTPHASRTFRFPPWARTQIISPETGREVREGDTGLIRIFDLANVWSVMAIQTEDLGIRRGVGFELLGRAIAAEARGCSLMTV